MANHKSYVIKQLRKAILRRSYLENKFHKDRSIENKEVYKRQQNIAIDSIRERERQTIYSNLNLNKIADNKSFGVQSIHSLVTKGVKDDIILVNEDNIISDDTEVAHTCNEFFKKCVNSL